MIRRRFNISKNQSANTIINYSTTDGQLISLPSNLFSSFGVLFKSHDYGKIKFYGNVTKIGDNAFASCSSLTSITIPDSVIEIGQFAFAGCSSLTSITIPDSVTSIGYYAFADCTNLVSFYGILASDDNRLLIYNGEIISVAIGGLISCKIPYNVIAIGPNAFANCHSLTSVTIPDSVTWIGTSAFNGCTFLTSVTIGNGVTSIGYNAFAYCHSLTSITIPDSVTKIGKEAFKGCISLTSVTIPDSVTEIGVSAFNSCPKLGSVYCKATTPPTLGSHVFESNKSGRKIYVPMTSVDAYKSAANWNGYASYIVGYNF